MTTAEQAQLSSFLEQITSLLDMPIDLQERAIEKYETLGRFLEEEDRQQGRRDPVIYAQGSFRLGTVIPPVLRDDEFDIDLVYERDLRKESITQSELKAQAELHLRRFVESNRDETIVLKERRRCWTLIYPESFHLDVLPVIPDDGGRESPSRFAETRILLTDRELREWQHSNPIGYAEWFRGRMAAQLSRARIALARSLSLSVEDVPEYRVKTPLQRAVQILKRHRDYHFVDDQDDKPISIIISTLAAQAYDNGTDLVETIITLVRRMPDLIESRLVNGERVSWVANPVNEDENFADKWEEYPERETKCRAWLNKVEQDVSAALGGRGIPQVVDYLSPLLGRSMVKRAAELTAKRFLNERETGNLKMASGSGILSSSGDVSIKKHTFYGVAEEED